MILFSTTDGIVIGVVALILIAIIVYLIVAYMNNPCGGCIHSKQCKASKKMSKSLLKNYKKCYKNADKKSNE